MIPVTVAALTVYPVKGCRGIDLQEAEVAPTGLACEGARDREWMVVDADGRFVTQREAPALALVRTALRGGRLELLVPGSDPLRPEAAGSRRDVVVWRSAVRGIDAGDACARSLSAHLGRDVRLVRFDDALPRPCSPEYVGDSGATTLFADGYPVLVIGRASLDDLNARLAARGFPALPMNRFRPNVVLDGIEPYDEDHLGAIAVGGVTLKPVKPCIRCEVTTTDQDTSRRNLEPLRTLATYRQDDRFGGVKFGVNAIVVSGAGATLACGMAGEAALRF